jgi:hypothetical protein
MENNEKMLEEIRKYCDPYSILVIAGKKLLRVRCPFRVRVLIACAGWNGGEIVWVERIMITRNQLQMIYIIGGNGFYFFLFQILPIY